jgi:hypothetical protein
VEKFKDCYRTFDRASLGLLPALYAPHAEFIDPVHRIQGLPAIHTYFESMCANVARCEFVYLSVLVEGDQACIKWQMTFEHPKLAGGRPVRVPGMSWLTIEQNLIVVHEDCYDMGAMLYEQVPLLGRLVTWVRRRLAADAVTAQVAG